MSRKRVPSYRHRKAGNLAVVTLCGKDFYLGPYNSKESREKYDRLIAEWLANGRRLPGRDRYSELSVAELIEQYWEFAKGYYRHNGKPSKELACMRDAMRPLNHHYGATCVRDFRPLSLKALRQKLIEADYCRTHINHQVNRIRRVFKWGVESELVPPDVCHALQAVAPLKYGRSEARESEPVRPVAVEHVDAVMPHVARQVAVMIQLQRLTGMRPGEVVALRPCEIDTSGDVWTYRPKDHKTAYRGHRREIYFGPRAQDLLRPWLDRRAEAFCFSPREAEEERNSRRRKHLRKKKRFALEGKRRKRDHYDTDSYRQAIGYGIRKAGVPHWSPNQLRHRCGTQIREDFGLDVAQVILGHRSADTTQVYAEVNRQKAIGVIRQIG